MAHRLTERREADAAPATVRDGGAQNRRGLPGPRGPFRLARSADSSAADAAETVLRLAVLLQAGVAPARAWEHLARTGDPAAVYVASSIDRGMPLPEAIATAGPGAWREVGAACQVALVVGAPLAECLRG
ncbi:hypothetical protein ACI3KY_19190, partial [Microbacterium sp. ZW T2_14]